MDLFGRVGALRQVPTVSHVPGRAEEVLRILNEAPKDGSRLKGFLARIASFTCSSLVHFLQLVQSV
jgi:hypothetical protein